MKSRFLVVKILVAVAIVAAVLMIFGSPADAGQLCARLTPGYPLSSMTTCVPVPSKL